MAIDKAILKSHLQNNPSDSLWDDLVGAWFFDDGSGTTVTDYGPNGYDGEVQLVGGASGQWTTDGYKITCIASVSTTAVGRFNIGYAIESTGTISVLSIAKYNQSDFYGDPVYGGLPVTLLSCHSSPGFDKIKIDPEVGDNIELTNYSDFDSLFLVSDNSTYTNVTYKGVTSEYEGVELGTYIGTYIFNAYAYMGAGHKSSAEASALLIWDRELSAIEIESIIDNNFDSTNPAVVQKVRQNNVILGGKQTVW